MTVDSFTEYFLLGIKAEGDASEYQFAGLTSEITGMEWGEKDIEGVPLANGGRVTKKMPMTDEEVSFKIYPIGVDKSNGLSAWFNGGTADSTDPYFSANLNSKKRHRIVLLWSESLPTTPGSAENAVPAGYNALRITAVNAYCTKYKPAFDISGDGLSAEATFKWTPFNKAGTANKIEESTLSAGLSAVTATPTGF